MAAVANEARRFDLVVHGATGYTGRLVSQYLARAPSASGIKWAVCGRSRSRLEELVALCTDVKANWHTKNVADTINAPSVLVADSTTPDDMAKLVASTKIVIACAGPFSLVGKALVAACVAAGTHYVDITGEFPFVREVIEAHHEAAASKGVFVVPSCGFDSVPSDLSNAYAFELAATWNATIRRVEAGFRIRGGGASRGTLESVLNIKNSIRRKDFSQLSLVGEAQREGVTVAAPIKRPKWSAGLKKWMGPFFMAAMNERLVLRSNSLVPERRAATYVEFVVSSFASAVAMTLVSALFVLLFLPGVAPLLRKFVFPGAGAGPSSLLGGFTIDVLGYASDTAPLPAVRGRMECIIPAYPFTAVSVSETALAILARETSATGGVLTSATAVGPSLKDRLVRSGYVWFTDKRSQAH